MLIHRLAARNRPRRSELDVLDRVARTPQGAMVASD
jgi:hypothetical protein